MGERDAGDTTLGTFENPDYTLFSVVHGDILANPAEPITKRAPAADTCFVATRGKPIELIVRRGAIRRFHKLKEKTADLPVEVMWDRRQEDRRATSGKVDADRRNGDRRRTPPFTWDLSDFVVATKPKPRKKR